MTSCGIVHRGKIVQCLYDVVNLKFQESYEFGCRNCHHHHTCLMSKIVLKRNLVNETKNKKMFESYY